MSAVDPITVEVGSAPITATVASTGLVLSIASGTVGPAGPTGPAGSNGTNGTNGVGVPAGGTVGQVLGKTGSGDYATGWVDQSGGGGGSGTVTSVSGTAPIQVATGTTTPVVSISAATTSAAGSMSSSDKAKLDGIATGATANATDAQLRDRSTHTGTQSAATVTGLASVATSGAYGDLSGRPTLGTAAAKDAPSTGNAAAGEVVLGSDSRLTDARTPSSTLSHASTHAAGGSDPVTLSVSQVTGAVPTTRTVNGQALSADVTVTAVPSGSAGGDLTGTYPNPTIAPGVIVDADVSASAAIAASKISGLATIATSGSASNLTAGTVPTGRLGTGTADATTFLRGDQTYAVPAGKATVVAALGAGSGVSGSTTPTSLLASTVTLPACGAGDVLIISGAISLLQNSTAGRVLTLALKLGATTVCSAASGSVTNSATTRASMFWATVRVGSGTSESASLTFQPHAVTTGTSTGVATETISGGALALDLLISSATATATQTYTLDFLTITKVAA